MTIEHVAGVAVRHPEMVAAGRHYGCKVETCVYDPESKGGSESTVRVAKEWVGRSENLALSGPSGSGKSHFVEALAHAVIDAGMRVSWFSLESLTAIIGREHQVVKLEILVGVPDEWIVDIAGGLNTSVQVQAKSLDDLAGMFDWLKDEIDGELYADQIIWRENDPGTWDVTYLLALLACFNIFEYPNEGMKHPVWAYGRKIGVLRSFETNPDLLKRLRPIAKDVFRLHDIVSAEAKDLYNERTGGKYGKWTFVQKKPSRYVFSGHPDGNQMLGGALFPILGAFRWAVIEGPDGNARWEGTFDDVLSLMRSVLPELVTLTGQASQDNGRNIHALGRSSNHWNSLHDKVGLRYLQQQKAAAGG